MQFLTVWIYLFAYFLIFGVQQAYTAVMKKKQLSKRDVKFLGDPCTIDKDCSQHVNGSTCDKNKNECVCSSEAPVKISNYMCSEAKSHDSVCLHDRQCKEYDSASTCLEGELFNKIVRHCACEKKYKFNTQINKCVRIRAFVFDEEPNASDDVVKGTVGGSIAMFTILLALIVWRKSKEYRNPPPPVAARDSIDNNSISCVCKTDLPPSYDDAIKYEKKDDDDEFKFPPSYQIAIENLKLCDKNEPTTSNNGIDNPGLIIDEEKNDYTVTNETIPRSQSMLKLVYAECHISKTDENQNNEEGCCSNDVIESDLQHKTLNDGIILKPIFNENTINDINEIKLEIDENKLRECCDSAYRQSDIDNHWDTDSHSEEKPEISHIETRRITIEYSDCVARMEITDRTSQSGNEETDDKNQPVFV